MLLHRRSLSISLSNSILLLGAERDRKGSASRPRAQVKWSNPGLAYRPLGTMSESLTIRSPYFPSFVAVVVVVVVVFFSYLIATAFLSPLN